MFSWKKDRAHISDDEPRFHVRYLGCTETYVPVGPGCTSRHVQKLWDNAPSERHLRKVTVKLGLGGIWMKGAPSDTRPGEREGRKDQVQNGRQGGEHDCKQRKAREQPQETGRFEAEKRVHHQNDRNGNRNGKGSDENGVDKRKNNTKSKFRHFNMEDVSFCAADKSVNDRIFCWISRCNREIAEDIASSDGGIGPLEVHAVLCSTTEKAQTMAAVMSRAFHLAYKDWRAEQQRENRKQHRKMSGTAEDGTDNGITTKSAADSDCSSASGWAEHCTQNSTTKGKEFGKIMNNNNNSNNNNNNICDNAGSRLVESSSSSSLSSTLSQPSSDSSKASPTNYQNNTKQPRQESPPN